MARRPLMDVPLKCAACLIALAIAGCHLARPVGGSAGGAMLASAVVVADAGATPASPAFTTAETPANIAPAELDVMLASAVTAFILPLTQKTREMSLTWDRDRTDPSPARPQATWASPTRERWDAERVVPAKPRMVRRPPREMEPNNPEAAMLVRHDHRRVPRFIFGAMLTALVLAAMRGLWRPASRDVAYCPHCRSQRIARYCANCGRALDGEY